MKRWQKSSAFAAGSSAYPLNALGIAVFRQLLPNAVAVFDTAFHQTLDDLLSSILLLALLCQSWVFVVTVSWYQPQIRSQRLLKNWVCRQRPARCLLSSGQRQQHLRDQRRTIGEYVNGLYHSLA
jgi:hypothetical protein